MECSELLHRGMQQPQATWSLLKILIFLPAFKEPSGPITREEEVAKCFLSNRQTEQNIGKNNSLKTNVEWKAK